MGETQEFCPKCGHKVSSSDVFCTNCGANLADFRIKPETKQPTSQKVVSKKVDPGKLATDKAESKTTAPKNVEPKKVEPQKTATTPNEAPKDTPKPAEPKKKPVPAAKTNSKKVTPVTKQSVPEPIHEKQATTDNLAKKPQRNSSKKLMPLLATVVILLVAYFGGSWYYSKNRQSQSLATDLTSGMTTKMASATVDAAGNHLAASELTPLVDLYNKDSTSAKEVSNAVQFPQGYNNFKLVQTGKYLGLYPKYKVQVSKQYIEIDTNVTNPIFTVDGKKVASINNGDEYKLDQNIPGVHKVSVESGSTKKSKSVLIPASGKANLYTIDIAEKAKKTTSKSTDTSDSNNDDSKLFADAVKNASSHHTSRAPSSDTDSDDDSDSDDTDLLGSWSNDSSTVTFNDDGTYSLDDKHGTYKVESQSGDQITINYSEDGNSGSGWTATYTIKDDELELNSNHMTWDKE